MRDKKEKQKITNNQQKIIKLIYKFRFINTNQFQKLFNHKYSTTVQKLLKDLKEKKYINNDYKRGDFKENTKPARWFLTPKGRRFLKGQKGFDIDFLERVYKEETRKPVFKNQCSAIVDIYLFLLSQKRKDEELKFFTEANLTKYKYFPDTELHAYVVLQKGKNIRRFFLHVFLDSIPDWLPKQKLKKYMKYYDENTWQENTKTPFPAILFVLPSQRLKTHIYNWGGAVLRKAVTSDINLFLTTDDTINSGTKNIWQKVF